MVDTPNPNPADDPKPGSPEYDSMMAARFREMTGRGGENPQADKPARPDHIPEKFWDAEKGTVRVDDLAKSYAELEKGRAKPAAPDANGKPQIPTDDPAKQVVENAGLDWGKVTSQLADTGALDETTIGALEKSGIPRAVIDDYMGALKAVSQAETAKAVAYVGGEENMNALLEWAGKSLSDPEKIAYNKQLGSRDGWKVALDTLSALRAKASPTAGEPTLQGGPGGRPAGVTSGYRSRSEMTKDMSDPQYRKDPAFRAAVAERMKNATWDLDKR